MNLRAIAKFLAVSLCLGALAWGTSAVINTTTRSDNWVFARKVKVEAGLEGSTPTSTLNITSQTSATTATSSVAAVTVAPTAVLDATDLLFAVKGGDGGIRFSVNANGALHVIGNAPSAGSALLGDAGTGIPTASVTVATGSQCACSNTTWAVLPKAVTCSVSSTTLTITAAPAGETTATYVCL